MTHIFFVFIHNSLVKAVADLGLCHCAIPCTDDVPAILTPLVKPGLATVSRTVPDFFEVWHNDIVPNLQLPSPGNYGWQQKKGVITFF